MRKLFSKLICLFLSIMLIVCGVPFLNFSANADSSNCRVENGDFEVGSLMGWDKAINTTKCNVIDDPTDITNKVLSVPATGDRKERNIFQKISNIVVNQKYRVTFRMKYNNITATDLTWQNFVGVSVAKPDFSTAVWGNVEPKQMEFIGTDFISQPLGQSNVGLMKVSSSSSSDWKTYTMYFTSDKNSVYFYFINYYGKADILIDDIVMMELPEDTGMIKNGTFSYGDLSNWDKAISTTKCAVISDPNDSENYILQIPSTNNRKEQNIFQKVDNITPNQKYKVTFRMKYNNITATDLTWQNFVGISEAKPDFSTAVWGNVEPGQIEYLGTDLTRQPLGQSNVGLIKVSGQSSTEWRNYTIYFTSDKSTVYFYFINFYGNADVLIDDIVMSDVPEDAGMIKNGTFSYGDLSSWDKAISTTKCEVISDLDDAENYILKIPATNNQKEQNIIQKINNITPNQKYKVTFRMKYNNITATELSWQNFVGISEAHPDFTVAVWGNIEPDDIIYRGMLFSKQTIGQDASGLMRVSDDMSTDWNTYTMYFTTDKSFVYFYFNNYYSKADIYIDDIVMQEFDYQVDTSLLVDFDTDEQIVISSDSYSWTKTNVFSHSGSCSATYDGSYSSAWNRISVTDKYGGIADSWKIKSNTTYRFSYWMMATTQNESIAVSKARFAVWGDGFETTEYQYEACNEFNQWEYKTIVFTPNADVSSLKFYMAGCFGDLPMKIYIDDICIEPIGSMIIEDNISNVYCEDYFNQIPSGNMEGNLKLSIWDISLQGVSQQSNEDLNVSQAGYSNLSLSGTQNIKYIIKLAGGKKYNFAFSYLTDKTQSIGVGLLNSNGTLIPPMEYSSITSESILQLTDTGGVWKRIGYTFLSPASGEVEFVISGSATGRVLIDEISLFLTKLGYTKNPNEYEEYSKYGIAPTVQNAHINSKNTGSIAPDTGENKTAYTVFLFGFILTFLSLSIILIYKNYIFRRNHHES